MLDSSVLHLYAFFALDAKVRIRCECCKMQFQTQVKMWSKQMKGRKIYVSKSPEWNSLKNPNVFHDIFPSFILFQRFKICEYFCIFRLLAQRFLPGTFSFVAFMERVWNALFDHINIISLHTLSLNIITHSKATQYSTNNASSGNYFSPSKFAF